MIGGSARLCGPVAYLNTCVNCTIVILMEQPRSECIRNCPQCQRQMMYTSEKLRDRAEQQRSLCKSCGIKNSRRQWSDEKRKEIGQRISRKKQSHTDERKSEIQQKRKQTIANWSVEKRENYRQRKSETFSRIFSGEGNPFYGRKHTDETKEKLRNVDRSYTKTQEFSERVKDAMVGIDTSVDLVKLWTEKFGEEEAHRREAQRRERLSVTMSGCGNPMFGKPAPLAAGGGVKGWYHKHFFRSLRELTYMLQLDQEGRCWKTGETTDFAISYVNPFTFASGTYYPDFIVDDHLMIECKPTNLQNTVMVKAKAQAAQEFCAIRGMVYEIIDPGKLTWDQLFDLVQSGTVILTERTKVKLCSVCSSSEVFPHQESQLGPKSSSQKSR